MEPQVICDITADPSVMQKHEARSAPTLRLDMMEDTSAQKFILDSS